MIKIVDADMHSFYKELETKKFYMFGAGRRAVILYEELELEGRIEAVVDQNSRLWAQGLQLGTEWVPVISLEQFVRKAAGSGLSQILLLINPAFYTGEIIAPYPISWIGRIIRDIQLFQKNALSLFASCVFRKKSRIMF